MMQASANYTDPEYSSDLHEKYRLSIQLRLNGFSFAIIDPERMLLMQLKEFRLAFRSKRSINEKWLDLQNYFLQFLHQEHFIIKSFQKVVFTIDHKEYTLMPKALVKGDNKNDYLLFNQSIAYHFESFTNAIPSKDFELIGAIYKPLKHIIQDYFDSFSLLHSSSVLQNEVLKLSKNKKTGFKVYVSVSNHDMHIIAIKDAELIMSNSFAFSSKEDFVYFILLSYDQLKINPEEDALFFLGDISKSSPIYQIAWQYVRNIHFIDHTNEISAGSAFDQMPLHQYYILIQSALCE